MNKTNLIIMRVFLLFVTFLETSGILFGVEAVGLFPPCGLPTNKPRVRRVIGGEEAVVGSWPWMAMLVKGGKLACAGSILNNRLIMTAAHCLTGTFSESPNIWQIYVGKHHCFESDPTERRHGIQRIIFHPHFNNSTLENDLALLVLDTDVVFDDHVLPICIPPDTGRVVPSGTDCYITGWGETRGTSLLGVLNQARVPILHDYWCSRPDWYGSAFFKNVSFCAGYKSGIRDACSGDSGGPLVCQSNGKYYAQGVTSWGHDCAQPQRPGIYTDVSVFVPWIRQKAEALQFPLQD